MKLLFLLVSSLVFALQSGALGARAADCEAMGNLRFVCGQSGPEDLAALPGFAWILASSYAAENGGIRLINAADLTATIPSLQERHDRKTYGTCPGPIVSVEKDKFRTHGLYLRPGKGSRHTLYAVHHGTRESIEVFEVDGRANPPTLVWIGCAVAPEKVGLNSVVGLPDGGFAATNFLGPDLGTIDDARAGKITGELWEWHSGAGWKVVPGSETSGPNGVEISTDGKWFYIGAWGSSSVIRLSRGRTPVKRDDVAAGFRVDNLRWAPDGSIFAAGQGESANTMTTSVVAKIDPNTLRLKEILRHPFNDAFSVGTAALQVGKELWVGSIRGQKIARFLLP